MVPTADLVMLGSLGKSFKKLREGLVFATTSFYKQTLFF